MSTPQFIDAHTHVQFAAFREDADVVIQRALDAGIWMVNVGTQRDTSAKAVEFSNRYPEGVYATVGLHPIHTDKSFHDEQELDSAFAEASAGKGGFTSRGEEFDYEYYEKLAQDPKVVAIGECGLDYYRIKGSESRIKQEKAFIQQIELAHEIQKPLMIHCRQAFDDLIRVLQATNYKLIPNHPGIIHFFSGTMDHAKQLLDLGFSFTFGGAITFTRDYDEVVRYIPLERILLETDAPYVAPVPYRGKRNEPLYVTEVARKVAETRQLEFDEVARQSVANARELLKI